MPDPSAALVAAMLAYASQVSGLPVPPGMPAPVVEISGRPVLGSYQDAAPWVGLTDMQNGHIFLHAGWRAADPQDRCILAHESTHWLQWANGKRYDPISRAEPLAYRTTALCFEAYRLPRAVIAWAWHQVARYSQ